MDGWLARYISYLGILALGVRILAFVSSLPQVGEVGGGWRMDVVVRVSLSCFVVL